MTLKTQLADVQGQMLTVSDEMEAIGTSAAEEKRDLNETDQELIGQCETKFNSLEVSRETISKAIAVQDRMSAAKATPQTFGDTPMGEARGEEAKLPARVRSQKSRVYERTIDAYVAGQFMSAIVGNRRAQQWCRDRGLDIRNAMSEGTNSEGGYAVPDIMAATIVRLVEEYGVFRRYARPAVMTSDTLNVPKYTTGLTVFYPAEGIAITPSDIVFGTIQLVAKKYAQLAIYSTELSEDSVISMADLITTDMAYQFALAEDTNSFLGDGTATYGGITGIANALLADSVFVSAGTTLAAVALSDFETMVAGLPEFPGIMPRWYMHKYVYYNSVVALLNAAGGTDIRQIEDGGEKMLLGYPVTFTQVMPGVAAGVNSQVAYFGDLAMGAYLGTNRNVTIKTLHELYAATDQIGIVGTMRSDTNIHSVGADVTWGVDPGAIIGLQLAAV